MQKIATRIFIWSSVMFGVIGILLILTSPGRNEMGSDFNLLLSRLLLATAFIILPSFALSIAGKYLNNKS